MKEKTTGIVNSNPTIAKLSGGSLAGNLYVKVDGVGIVKCFYDDYQSLEMFSFQEGDEVKIEWWEVNKGGNTYLNGNVLTPKGSADAEEMLEAAMHRLSGGSVSGNDSILDDMAEILIMCRNAVINAGIEETIGADVSDDAAEETIRTSANSLFIQLSREGIGYEGLLG